MRFHVVALPHTKVSKEYLACAYSQKVLNFVRMMRSLGHDVFLYAGEGSETNATEQITTVTAEQREKWFGHNDWKKEFFAIEWDQSKPYWVESNARAIMGILDRIQPQDFICLIGGNCQKMIADAFPNHMTVEFGIGYEGVFSKYRVFESYAWMHYLYGKIGVTDGQNYDCVIPNYYDPSEFKLSEKEDYFLFIGRLISRKGIQVAADVCRRLGKRLVVAGQGAKSYKDGIIECEEMSVEGVEYVGTVGVAARADLMSKAKAVFVQTGYIGPFEGVHAEAMLSGTPVITTDWGVFSETVVDGVTGFRTRSLGETMWAAEVCGALDPHRIREYAIRKFSLDNIRHRYEDYFQSLLTLWKDGWYTESYDPTAKRLLGNFS